MNTVSGPVKLLCSNASETGGVLVNSAVLREKMADTLTIGVTLTLLLAAKMITVAAVTTVMMTMTEMVVVTVVGDGDRK